MAASLYEPVLEYIQTYWQRFLSAPPATHGWRNHIMQIGRIPLPYPIIAPNDQYFAGTQFYWDTYFTVLGLVVAGQVQVAKGMVDNLCILFEKFGYIPARNSWTSIGRTQPPYLTRMAFEVYEHGGADLAWLERVIRLAETEYKEVWLSGERLDLETGLSRYQPRFWKSRLTVYESGWDSSARYTGRAHRHLIPVDLNCQLYVYETDFATLAQLTGNHLAMKHWQQAARKRKRLINKYFWDDGSGFYYDYNLETGRPCTLKTLAGYYPLWSGAANPVEARRAVRQLLNFEQTGGLTNTELLPWQKHQWDYPNGWPPQQYVVYQGLKRYGYPEEAERIARKWLNLQAKLWHETGTLWEKYDVVHGKVGLPGRYPTQPGFSWTAAVFARLTDEL